MRYLHPLLVYLLILVSASLAGEPSQRIEARYGTPTAIEAEYVGYVRGHAGHATEWVAEYLDAEVLKGDAQRKGIPFSPDKSQPKEFRVDNGDYRAKDSQGGKYDRGHLANAADNHRSHQAMVETFGFTNMTPQTAQLNRSQQKWAGLESHVRDLALDPGAKVWVFTGPAFLPNEQGDIVIRTVGKHTVWVPSHCFKAVLVENAESIEVFAWLMPNTTSPPDWQECAVSVDELEAATGFNFFAGLPDEQEDELEAGH